MEHILNLHKQLGWLGKSKPDYADNKLPDRREDLKYELYPKNGEQMWKAYKRYSRECNVVYDDDAVLGSIERTSDIAFNRIDSFYPVDEVQLPEFVVPKDKTEEEALMERRFHANFLIFADGLQMMYGRFLIFQ